MPALLNITHLHSCICHNCVHTYFTIKITIHLMLPFPFSLTVRAFINSLHQSFHSLSVTLTLSFSICCIISSIIPIDIYYDKKNDKNMKYRYLYTFPHKLIFYVCKCKLFIKILFRYNIDKFYHTLIYLHWLYWLYWDSLSPQLLFSIFPRMNI